MCNSFECDVVLLWGGCCEWCGCDGWCCDWVVDDGLIGCL